MVKYIIYVAYMIEWRKTRSHWVQVGPTITYYREEVFEDQATRMLGIEEGRALSQKVARTTRFRM